MTRQRGEPAPTGGGSQRIDINALTAIRQVRRGLDPRQVAALLDEANRRIEQMQAQRDTVAEENGRLKNALRRWQTEQFEGTHRQRQQPRPLRDNEDPR